MVIGLLQAYTFSWALNLCLCVATELPEESHVGGLVLLQKWSEAIQGGDDEPEPLDCTAHTGIPIQAIARSKHSDIIDLKKLNIPTGAYYEMFPVSGVYNGCDISPVSSWAYCSNRVGTLARFDSKMVRYVAKLPKGTFSAGFSSQSDTYYFTIWDSASETSDLYSLQNVDKMPGYANAIDEGITDATNITPIVTGIPAFLADLVAINGDFDGKGTAEYLLSLVHTDLYLIKADGDQVFVLKSQRNFGYVFGAGWHFQNNAYFANDEGKGVVWVEISSINIADGTVTIELVGKSAPTYQNDGMNCHNASAPRSWTTTTTTEVATPSPNEEEVPTPAPGVNGCDNSTSGTCSIYEDPHIEVFDGRQISLMEVDNDADSFETKGGDKWLVKSDRVSIQGRYDNDNETPERKMFMQAIAIGGSFLGGNKIIVGPLETQILWNDAPVLRDDESSFLVNEPDYFVKARRGKDSWLVEDMSQPNHGVNIALPLGVHLVVNRLKHHVNVAIKMCRQEGQDGLCGNFNGLAADDALEFQSARSQIDVSPEESLFV